MCVLPVCSVTFVSNEWVAVALIGLAASAHQGWAANLFMLVSDTMPGETVASVVGIGGFAGSLGGMGIAAFVGWVLETTNSYTAPFILAALAYPTALLVMHFLLPHGGRKKA